MRRHLVIQREGIPVHGVRHQEVVGTMALENAQIRDDAVALRKTGGVASKIDALWDREKALKDETKAELATAKAKQEAGDTIYWPVFNLDIKNPFSAEALEHLPPETLADSIAQKSMRISAIMDEVKSILGTPASAAPGTTAGAIPVGAGA